jgi:ankyrin repeat protein
MKRDYLLLGIVTLMSLAANLPQELIGLTGIDRRMLVLGLVLVVAIALVRYSKLVMIFCVVILAFGANLPQELAAKYNIEPGILMAALIAIIVLALANHYLKLPTGLDKRQGFVDYEGTQALLRAVMNGRLQDVRQLIETGLDLNTRSRHGYTPLMIAAARGYGEIVDLLLDNGAALTMVDPHGRNALQIAREARSKHCIESLLEATHSEISSAKDAAPTT